VSTRVVLTRAVSEGVRLPTLGPPRSPKVRQK
jgi:hypothetical protein